MWGDVRFGWSDGCIGLAMSYGSSEGEERLFFCFENCCSDLMVEEVVWIKVVDGVSLLWGTVLFRVGHTRRGYRGPG